MTAVLTLLALALAAAALWLGLGRARRLAIRDLLDAADALEGRLRTARSELEAVAGDHENPVRGAMQDLLRQRLWLQEHGAGASLRQLREVRASLEAARGRLDQQLLRIEQARAGSTA